MVVSGRCFAFTHYGNFSKTYKPLVNGLKDVLEVWTDRLRIIFVAMPCLSASRMSNNVRDFQCGDTRGLWDDSELDFKFTMTAPQFLSTKRLHHLPINTLGCLK